MFQNPVLLCYGLCIYLYSSIYPTSSSPSLICVVFLLDFYRDSLGILCLWYFVRDSYEVSKGCLWDFHWIPMGIPWHFYNISIGFLEDFQATGLLWYFYETTMGFQLGFHNMTMIFQWYFCGFLWGFQEEFWAFHGCSMIFPWDVKGLQWDFHWNSMICLWDYYNFSIGLPWDVIWK